MNLLPLFQWFDSTTISNIIRNSTNIFPVLEVFHLFGLTLLLGTITITDLRMLGFGMKRQSLARVAAQLAPYTEWAAAVTIGTGILLFLSEAMKCYTNAAFPYKMAFLLAGIIVYYFFQKRITRPGSRATQTQLRVVAILSLSFWYGVAIAGRAIAFV